MAEDRAALLAEAYERGILPPDMRSAYEEAQKRGILGKSPQQDVANMSAGDVAVSAVKNIPSSAGRLASDIAQPFIHPVETAENIGKIGKGVLQKLGIMKGKDAEGYADAVGAFLVERYGSGQAIKKTLATDPVGMATDLSMIFSGGATATARAPGILGKVSRVAEAAGRAIDPLNAAAKTVKGVGKLAAEGLGVTTGAGSDAIRIAAEAGAKGGEAGKSFLENLAGKVPMEDVVTVAKGAVDNLGDQRRAAYKAGMIPVKNDKTILSFNDIDRALNEIEDIHKFGTEELSPATRSVRQRITEAVDRWKNLQASTYWTPEGFDALKKLIGDIAQDPRYASPNAATRTPSQAIADTVYDAIRDTIAKQAPEYSKVMKDYEEATKQIREITRTLSLGKNARTDTALRKLQSILRNNVNTNYGQRAKLAGVLEQSGAPNLSRSLAGQALSSVSPRGLSRILAGGEGFSALSALAAGQPHVAAGIGAGLLASSPALVGGAAYGAGALTRLPLRGLGRSSFQLGRLTQQP